jgi:hypothetical protein
LPDNDAEGRVYAQTVAGILTRLSPPAEVRIVELPGLPPKGDCVEWLEARDAQTPEDIVAELDNLIVEAEKSEEQSTSKAQSGAYFDVGRNCYWICDDRGGWIPLNETQFKRMLRHEGVSPKVLEGAYVSLLDLHLIDIQRKADVHYAGGAGWLLGRRLRDGRATNSRNRIATHNRAEVRQWSILNALIDGLLTIGKSINDLISMVG